jgi:hypothetical protein
MYLKKKKKKKKKKNISSTKEAAEHGFLGIGGFFEFGPELFDGSRVKPSGITIH